MTHRAFTLIELLVVITIIVVLLALLTPALDRAIYQAELAACGSRQHGIARGAMMYAAGHQRNYPYRPGPVRTGTWWHPHKIWDGNSLDDRPILRDYVSINGILQDPLGEQVDLENSQSGSHTYSAYYLWFGWSYAGRGTVRKIGDRIKWGEHRLPYLVSDMDDVRYSDGVVYNSHPDRNSKLTSFKIENGGGINLGLFASGNYTLARWHNITGQYRGGTDLNYAGADGSVRLLDDVRVNIENLDEDDRMVKLGEWNEDTETVQSWTQLPRN